MHSTEMHLLLKQEKCWLQKRLVMKSDGEDKEIMGKKEKEGKGVKELLVLV